MLIEDRKVVTFSYTLTNDQNEVLDASQPGSLLCYLHGADNIIPGLEQALTGKAVGDKLQVTIEAADAYGEHNPELTQVIPASMFTGVDQIEVGMHFQADTEMGPQSVRIAKVDGDEVTIDGNHPLAGVRLHFDVEIADVRDANADELASGFPRQPE